MSTWNEAAESNKQRLLQKKKKTWSASFKIESFRCRHRQRCGLITSKRRPKDLMWFRNIAINTHKNISLMLLGQDKLFQQHQNLYLKHDYFCNSLISSKILRAHLVSRIGHGSGNRLGKQIWLVASGDSGVRPAHRWQVSQHRPIVSMAEHVGESVWLHPPVLACCSCSWHGCESVMGFLMSKAWQQSNELCPLCSWISRSR